MGVLRRLYWPLLVATLVVGALHIIMTGSLARALIHSSIRQALAAPSLAQMQPPIQEALRYLRLHESIISALRFLAPRPEKSRVEELSLKLQTIDIYCGALAHAPKAQGRENMQFALDLLGEVQAVRPGVWRAGQARASAVIFWALFAATSAAGIGRLRQSRRAGPAEPQRQEGVP